MLVLDLHGQRFGSLTVIKRVASARSSNGFTTTRWLVRCDCGTTRTCLTRNLKGGRTRTCVGATCPYHQALAKAAMARLPPNPMRPDSGFRGVIRGYKNKAAAKGVVFTLAEPELRRLFESECFFCGAPPSNIMFRDRPSPFVYSGLDRIVPVLGYVSGNVRGCCWICNRMKHVLSDDEFLGHIRKILRHWK